MRKSASLRAAAPPHSPTILNLQKLQYTHGSNAPAAHADDDILPAETVITLLDSFAKSLLLDRRRLASLKTAATADVDPQPAAPPKSAAAPSSSSILKSPNTVLTYMTWGIKHIEKASSTPANETRKEHLKKAEQMLRSLTDSMQDLDRSSLTSARVPNAAAIAAVAHFFLALVWKLRKNCARNVASHLLQAFVVCPKNSRQTLAPELWRQLFQPHLSAVEAWYRHERSSISADQTGGVASSSASAPMPSAVFKANYLMDLVAGMNNKKSNSGKLSGNLTDRKRAEKLINMQVNLLVDLYEQSLDDGTQQFAKKYQDLISNYFDDSMESCRSSGPENSFALSDVETPHRIEMMAAAAAAMRHRDAIASASAKIFPRDRITAAMEAPYLRQRRSSSSPSTSGDSSLLKHATGGGTTQRERAPPPELATGGGGSKNKGGGVGHESSNRNGGGRSAALSVVKKGSSTGRPNQASLLRMCSKIYRPEVLDPLKNMLQEAQSAPIGRRRRGKAKTTNRRRRPQPPPSLRQGTSGPISVAPHSKLLKAHSSRSTRLIDLMAHESSSNSWPSDDSDRAPSPTPSLRSYIRHQKRAVVRSTAGSDTRAISRRRDQFKGMRVTSSRVDKATSRTRTRKKGSRSRSSSRADRTLQRDAQVKMVPARSRRRRPAPQRRSAATLSSSSRNNLTAWCRPVTMAPEQDLQMRIQMEKPNNDNMASHHMLQQRRRSSRSTVPIRATDRQRNRRLSLTTQLQSSPSPQRLHGTLYAAPPPPAASPVLAGDDDFLHIQDLAMELQNAVTASRSITETSNSTSRSATHLTDAITRCEEALLQFAHAWLNRKPPDTKKLLDELMGELLYVLGVSELQEVQRLALCLLSSTTMAARSTAARDGNDDEQSNSGVDGDWDAQEQDIGLGFSQKQQRLSSHDPHVLQALSNLLKQPTRLPEAALLLHLLHPERYSAACNHYLPHLLPLLLDLVQKNKPIEAKQGTGSTPPPQICAAATTPRRRSQDLQQKAMLDEEGDDCVAATTTPRRRSQALLQRTILAKEEEQEGGSTKTPRQRSQDLLHRAMVAGEGLGGGEYSIAGSSSSSSTRAMALMMMSRLLSAVDATSRRQCCRHVLFPAGAIASVMESLDSGGAAAEEKSAASFILGACMEAGEECRRAVVKRLKVSSLFSLLHVSSSASMASFQTAIHFASLAFCSTFRKSHMIELLQRFQQGGMLNCMDSLMSYIQMAPIENQPLAAGLLLQLDLLLGDEQRYSIFREEAIDALLSPLILDNNQEACMNATHVLCTIGSNHTRKELEAWLLKKAGLASPHRTTQVQSKMDAISSSPSSSCDSKDGEDADGVLSNWDEVVSRALMSHKGGLKVSYALGQGLRSDLGEKVRRSCIMVIAWLTSHLITDENILRITSSSPQHNLGGYNRAKLIEGLEHLTQSIQPQLRSIVAIGSPYAIDERVFAALALQNLGLHTTEDRLQ